ncbi:hemolysin XhlA family protein [uncultured Clostridium sp.]|uniref:hemolysin XhlA family protein n=1 Tax=uncultured Clostridium sp. TaxID=59620 RepID=UPI0028E4DA3B|nr:hemolysin XhlA family protein [uncultured Clostridium sp.]
MDALVKEKLEEHDKLLDKHENDIGTLKKNDAINSVRLDNLCKSLDNLTGTLKWLSGFLLSATGLLIVYFIEQISQK